MKNKTTLDFNKKEDKHFFAGLFNTAVNNFDLSLRELNKRMNHKEIKGQKKEEKIIEYAFSDERLEFEFDNHYKFLSESLIFIKRLPSFIDNYNKKNRGNGKKKLVFKSYLKFFLLDLYKTLDSYRNYYTHFEHKEVNVESDIIFDFLNYILFNSSSNIKDNRVKTKVVKEKLHSKYSSDFVTIIEKKNKWIEKTNKELKKESKRLYGKFRVNTEKGNNFALNSIFRYLIDDSTNKPSLTKYAISKDGNNLTSSGFIQLLAFFLNKKQINLLFDNVQYTKYTGDTELQKIITRWVYTFESYKDIKHLFKSDYDNHSLLLQMVSELTKCPKELYHHLSENDKLEFLEDINVYIKDNTNLINDDALVSHEVLRKRYQDKFAYFAIRFLDEFAKFPTLRFQVSMGKFNHDTKEKEYSNNKKTTRRILENITVFENLSKATKAKTEYFKTKEKEDGNKNEAIIDIKDWVEHPRPKYQFFGNNIGIWMDIDNLGEYTKKETNRDNNKLTKYAVLEKLKLDDKFKKPIAYLSNNELPALLYSLLIDGKSGEDIEKVIKSKIRKQRGFIKSLNVDKNYSEEEFKKLPKKIRTILNNKGSSINRDKIERQLKEELEVNALKSIRANYIPKDKEKLSLKEKGKIATWLSKDIKRFTKKEIKENWKGHQFAQFQALLSYYDIDHSNINTFLLKDLNFDVNTGFAFKEGIKFGKKTLYDFYCNYIKERKKYIKKLIDNFDNTESEILLQPFKVNKFTIKTLEKYIETKLKEPVMLSRGLFDDKPTAVREDKETANFANWFKVSMNNNKAQEFYNFDKYYVLTEKKVNNKMVDSAVFKINNSQRLSDQYKDINNIKDNFILSKEQRNTIKDRASQYKIKQKEIYKNEAVLRKTMRNDFYVLQMIKTFFAETSEIDKKSFDEITLKDFYLTKAEKQKIKEQSNIQSTKEKGDTSKRIFNDSYILNNRIKLPLLDGKIICEVSLKESSKYKKLSQDQKVIQLTNYDPDKVWNVEDVENEINDYELIRSRKLFKQIHKLEKTIYNKAKEENKLDKLLVNTFPNFKKYLVYYFLNDKEAKEFYNLKEKDFSAINDRIKQVSLLVELRNKFAHNQLISTESFEYINNKYSKQKNERVATYLNRVFNEIIKKIENN